MFIAMRLLMHYLGAFCDALSQCIIAGRYRDAAVQFFIAISSLVTFVMHYRVAFRDVLLQPFRLYRDIWVSRDYSLNCLLGHLLSTFIQYIYWP